MKKILATTLIASMIMIDNDQTCFASYEGIMCEDRNPSLTVEQAEDYLKNYLNVINIIWIPHGLPFDETKGRLENIMYVVDNKTILVSWTNNAEDDRYQAVKAAYDILLRATNVHGKRYNVIKVPLPPMDVRNEEDIKLIDYNIYHQVVLPNQKLVTSYVNLYISNKIVLIPSFNHKETQEKVLDIMSILFNDKQIIVIDVRELLLGKSGLNSFICYQPELQEKNNP
ncbi:agmatine deiminase family protein [Spiroplasma sp. AdecLV25b]|uniref:agmatine deiminase family protein n=1 Tax=Spiroplasma sp. AdecLV25b TaxID=3027162 RepID=UPI0027E0DF84|nr:agmatine deiminase family protein [Spiroplasma sp. AdecLV25b]